MNDFTKNELATIKSALIVWIRAYSLAGGLISPPLLDKVKSMIDNYCEHEHTKVVPANCVLMCANCQKVVEE